MGAPIAEKGLTAVIARGQYGDSDGVHAQAKGRPPETAGSEPVAAEQGAAVSGIDRSLCPGCGYWLAGPIGNLPGRRCPHCGYVNEHARAERTLGPGDRVALDERARLLERSSIVPNIRDNEPPAPRTLSNNQRAEWAAILQQCGYAEREIERVVRAPAAAHLPVSIGRMKTGSKPLPRGEHVGSDDGR